MTTGQGGEQFRFDIAALLCVILFTTYAWFWQERGWNEASRLALTYSLGDRGTISIDGLEEQTGDRSYRAGHYYCDKPPGQSLLGFPVYLLLKSIGVAHPVDGEAIAYWWPDYVLTVATTSLLTALLGALIYAAALRLGCSQGTAAMVALCYGLGTPALVYASLFVGHQTAAFCAFGGYLLLATCKRDACWTTCRLFAAGLLAGYAVVTEYPMLFTSEWLLIYALA